MLGIWVILISPHIYHFVDELWRLLPHCLCMYRADRAQMPSLFQPFQFHEVWERWTRKNCHSALLPLCDENGGSNWSLIHLAFSCSLNYKSLECYLLFFTFQVSLTQARIDMSELDEDSDGFLQPQVWTYCKVWASKGYIRILSLFLWLRYLSVWCLMEKKCVIFLHPWL